MTKFEIIKNKISEVSKFIWILVAIVLVGIFMRTYNFHDWLDFKTDQSRDATLVADVINGKASWPLLGATMNGSASSVDGQFRIGPMYYYFQIISAKIFGDYPDKLAYPDLIFSILSIPLFYIFLRKYFNRNLALWLSGLYSISFFSVRFAHFAWNSNSIPFFTLLLLLALYEFRSKKEHVSLMYTVVLGIAWGIGFQLHAISMILFSSVCFYFFVLSVFEKPLIWKKWLIVFILLFALNLSQIISEVKNDFSNTKIFFQYFSGSSGDHKQKTLFLSAIGRDIDCHIEANFYMLSALGEDSCSLYASKVFASEKSKSFLKDLKNPWFEFKLLLGLLFSVIGYVLLAYNYKKNKAEKHIFINILTIYALFSFLVMIPVSGGDVEFRYFNIIFFMPLLFLGFFVEYLVKYSAKVKNVIISIVVLSIIASNLGAFLVMRDNYLQRKGINSHQVVLGEIEPITQYILANSAGQDVIYLGGDYDIVAFVYNPLAYLMKRNEVSLIMVTDKSESGVSLDKSVYYLKHKPSIDDGSKYEKIGSIYVYKLKN